MKKLELYNGEITAYVTIADTDKQNTIEETTPTPFTDTDATWNYWTVYDTQEKGVPDDYVWERLRSRRDSLLASCDYRMVNDAPWDLTKWVTYRKLLRDLPKKTKNPRLAEWPVAPSE